MPERRPGDRRILIEDVYDEEAAAEIQALVEQVHAAKRAALTPLIDRFNEVGAKITEKEEEVARLKREQSALRNKIREEDRDALPSAYMTKKNSNGKKKRGGKPMGHAVQVAAEYREKLDKLTEWLQEKKAELNAMERQNFKGFRAIDIEERVPITIGGSSLTKMLDRLHDEGIVRLEIWKRGADHSATGGMLAGKFFTVV